MLSGIFLFRQEASVMKIRNICKVSYSVLLSLNRM